jgi:hypothetical protein
MNLYFSVASYPFVFIVALFSPSLFASSSINQHYLSTSVSVFTQMQSKTNWWQWWGLDASVVAIETV